MHDSSINDTFDDDDDTDYGTVIAKHTAEHAHVNVVREPDGTFTVFALWDSDDSYTQDTFTDETLAREAALAIAADQLLTGTDA